MVVLPFPALANVAVSAEPGAGEADQFVVEFQLPSVAPFQVPLVACADWVASNETKATLRVSNFFMNLSGRGLFLLEFACLSFSRLICHQRKTCYLQAEYPKQALSATTFLSYE
jgi:hypothetical protein